MSKPDEKAEKEQPSPDTVINVKKTRYFLTYRGNGNAVDDPATQRRWLPFEEQEATKEEADRLMLIERGKWSLREENN